MEFILKTDTGSIIENRSFKVDLNWEYRWFLFLLMLRHKFTEKVSQN